MNFIVRVTFRILFGPEKKVERIKRIERIEKQVIRDEMVIKTCQCCSSVKGVEDITKIAEENQLNEIWRPWENKCPLSLNFRRQNIDFLGWSRAALRTNFIMKNWRIAFDAGLSCPYKIEHLFLTHGHCDHSASIFFYTLIADNISIYAPEEIAGILQRKIDTDYELTEGCVKDEAKNKSRYKIIPVSNNTPIITKIKGEQTRVEFIKCKHSVPCYGYGLSDIKKRRKEEFKDLIGDDVRITVEREKKEGRTIMEEYDEPFFLFLGDTNITVFEDERVLKYSIIMVECSFIKDDELQQAIDTDHIHWSQLESIVKDNPNIKFILYHFSLRYKAEEIKDFFNKVSYDNVYPWISN